jgi:hypothetical protein
LNSVEIARLISAKSGLGGKRFCGTVLLVAICHLDLDCFRATAEHPDLKFHTSAFWEGLSIGKKIAGVDEEFYVGVLSANESEPTSTEPRDNYAVLNVAHFVASYSSAPQKLRRAGNAFYCLLHRARFLSACEALVDEIPNELRHIGAHLLSELMQLSELDLRQEKRCALQRADCWSVLQRSIRVVC